jgi:hypothetical protein
MENRDLCFYLFTIINKTHRNKLKGGSPKEDSEI